MHKLTFTLILIAIVCAPTESRGAQITPVTAHGWPVERTSGNPPPSAIDGDLGTFTWTTESSSFSPGYLGLAFTGLENVNRLRLWKDNSDGHLGANYKDLEILYTTGSGPMASRLFQNVSGLQNGFFGTELMDASAVNANGTVTDDVHNSVSGGDGWASLTWDNVQATGIAIRFFSDSGGAQHYKVHEFEAHFEASLIPPIPEPSSLLISSLLALVVVRRRRK